MVSKKTVGIILVAVIVVVVFLFGNVIAPTTISSPIQFDLSNPSQTGTSETGRSCELYPNDPGC